jgi:hypothetical protein
MANTTGKKFGGRKKGTPNKDTAILRERIDALLQDEWDNILTDLKELKPKERIDVFTTLLEYSLPKLSRTENSHLINENDEVEADLSQLTTEELKDLIAIYEKLGVRTPKI